MMNFVGRYNIILSKVGGEILDKSIIRIHCLSEYIDVIKQNNLQNFYFRGENKKYQNISSSLLRSFSPTNDTYGLIDIYTQLLSTYYQEVGYELNNLQIDNFLAFSQHHGIKTNLIDFTTAPLVALYFACDKSQYENGAAGYVYLINKASTIDASKFINKISINKAFAPNHNLFSRFANGDQEIINQVL